MSDRKLRNQDTQSTHQKLPDCEGILSDEGSNEVTTGRDINCEVWVSIIAPGTRYPSAQEWTLLSIADPACLQQ